VTFWYPSVTKAVLIKLRRKTFTWVVMACLPDPTEAKGEGENKYESKG
jgi:hypothetical protein